MAMQLTRFASFPPQMLALPVLSCTASSSLQAAPHRHRRQGPPRRYKSTSPTTLIAPSSSSTPLSLSSSLSSSSSAFSRHHQLTRPFSTTTSKSPTMAPLPSTMKAVQITKNGGIDVLEHVDIPVPKPSPTQVLIKNEYAGINYIDTYFRTGLYPAPKFPLILGREAAGEVIACGAEANPSFAPGTKVVYMEPGAYAEYSAISAANVVAIPDDVSTETAAAAYLQGLTAWTLIRESAHVQKDQWTLVHAAAGGVGSLLVQMLRGVGAKIIATASSDDKLALAKKYGADYTVNSNDDVVAKVKEITGGHGIDAIFDGVGKATFDADLEMIAMKGNLISFGNASGAVPPVSILKLGAKNVRLMRPVLNGYVAVRKDLEKYAAELFEFVRSGKLDVVVHEVYPLKDAGRAHTDIESRKTKGKLLLKL